MELARLPMETEPETPYELSESVPELIKFVVEMVLRPPGVRENFDGTPVEFREGDGAEM